jgi:hypothetical protein
VPRLLPINICPATVDSYAPYLPVFVILHILHTLHQLSVDFHTGATDITQKSKHTSYFSICHGYSRLSIFNLTYLWYPLTVVQWHNLYVPITCLNLQSYDISCQTYCYLIFLNFLVYLSEAEHSKYGTRNTSTTGSTTRINKDMSSGVTDEVREITWFYKQS